MRSSIHRRQVWEAKYDGSITDAIIADNYLQEQIYLRAFWLNPDTEILRFGFPQNDVIERDKNNSSKIDCLKNTLFINSQIYYVLYAPTFRDDFSTEGYNIDFERVIKAFEIRMKKKTKIIIRLHPNVAFQKEKIRFSENILDGTDYPNMQDLALVCDAVISDYSSTLFDFSMLDKPAFVCALDYKEYEEKRGFIPEFYEFPFPFATSNNELINVIQKYDEKEYKDNISSFYSKYPTYCDGHSSKRVCDWILNHMVLMKGEKGQAYNVGHDDVITIKKMAEIYADAGSVTLTATEPTEDEVKAFNPMRNSALDNSKLKKLGYKDTFSVDEGLRHTVEILKEIAWDHD